MVIQTTHQSQSLAPLLVFSFLLAQTCQENMCQKSGKQVQRICVKRAKNKFREFVSKSEKQIHMNVSKELKGSKVTANRLYA
jgi:hypothetical protein